MKFRSYPDRDMMMLDLANVLASELAAALRQNDEASFCVPGGTTPGPVFDVLPKFAGPKVIYAAANRMGGRAAREGITFKQTPYALEL